MIASTGYPFDILQKRLYYNVITIFTGKVTLFSLKGGKVCRISVSVAHCPYVSSPRANTYPFSDKVIKWSSFLLSWYVLMIFALIPSKDQPFSVFQAYIRWPLWFHWSPLWWDIEWPHSLPWAPKCILS